MTLKNPRQRKGELKDHFLTLTREELNNPSNNICAGIRWLFRKQAIASSLLKKTATWEEAVAEFKGTRIPTKARAKELMDRFNEKLSYLKNAAGLKFIFISFCFFSTSADTNNHLNELNSAFPYALLTDDFGILTKEDLKINSCIAEPAPISKIINKSYSYPYWQCFEIKKTNVICEGRKYDPESKSRVSMLVLSGVRDGERHEFISRRTIPLDSCRLYQKDWRKLTRNEEIHLYIRF